MTRFTRWLPVLMAILILPACAGIQKRSAEKALTETETAYAKLAEQARNVAPEQAQEIEAGIAAAKANLAKGDAQSVLTAAKELSEQIKTLAEALPGLQTKLQDDWNDLAKSVPGAIASLKNKLDDFGRPPAGMPGRARFDSTAARAAPLGQRWEEAKSLFASGKLARAVALAQAVRDEAVKWITEMQTGS